MNPDECVDYLSTAEVGSKWVHIAPGIQEMSVYELTEVPFKITRDTSIRMKFYEVDTSVNDFAYPSRNFNAHFRPAPSPENVSIKYVIGIMAILSALNLKPEI